MVVFPACSGQRHQQSTSERRRDASDLVSITSSQLPTRQQSQRSCPAWPLHPWPAAHTAHVRAKEESRVRFRSAQSRRFTAAPSAPAVAGGVGW